MSVSPKVMEETIKAMGRLKEKNEKLEIRVSNLEKAFEMAFKNGAASLEQFLAQLDSNDAIAALKEGQPQTVEEWDAQGEQETEPESEPEPEPEPEAEPESGKE